MDHTNTLTNILRDRALKEELLAKLAPGGPGVRTRAIVAPLPPPREVPPAELRALVEGYSPDRPPPSIDPDAERIIRLYGRPVLLVQGGDFGLPNFEEPESPEWGTRLEAARLSLRAAIQAVGKIELSDHYLPWVGTGWLIAQDLVVTNRHVAREFAWRSGARWVFRQHPPTRQPARARINFRGEYDRPDVDEVPVDAVVYVEDDPGPDIAFLRLRGRPNPPAPINLAETSAPPGRLVAVIGYPSADGRQDDPQATDRIFAGIYGVKRLAPGEILAGTADLVSHDCTTLGGSSGSVVLDLQTGKAAGLHWGGTYGLANYAVPAAAIADRLKKLG
jgi:endonuclease G